MIYDFVVEDKVGCNFKCDETCCTQYKCFLYFNATLFYPVYYTFGVAGNFVSRKLSYHGLTDTNIAELQVELWPAQLTVIRERSVGTLCTY